MIPNLNTLLPPCYLHDMNDTYLILEVNERFDELEKFCNFASDHLGDAESQSGTHVFHNHVFLKNSKSIQCEKNMCKKTLFA